MAGLPEHSPLQPKGSTGPPDVAAATRYLEGRSPAWRAMAEWIRRIAPTRLPVLVLGESGAGKEGVARAVHALGDRNEGPFLALNCAAVADTLLDAELFGSTRGAYTGAHRDRTGLFQRASGGTLFLDEVAEMSTAMQGKLLRVLESRRVRPVGGSKEHVVNVRVVAATNSDLGQAAMAGQFREDLYFRLAVAEVQVPPLRDRLEDLPLLVESLAGRLRAETGHGPPRLDPGGWRRLSQHDWPGNVRELHAALARALLRTDGGPITADALGVLAAPERRPAAPAAGPPAARRKALEQRMIKSALAETGGNVAAAARRIGWTRQKLYRRLAALRIPPPSRTLFDDR